jgi:hypothetical protein
MTLLILALVGWYAIMRPAAGSRASFLNTAAVAAVLTAISFGGWWWTEVMYDRHVIHSVPELHQSARPPEAAP